MMDEDLITRMLIKDEDCKGFPYKCSEGYLTIGIGHNLEAAPLPHQIIMQIFKHDLYKVTDPLTRLSWFSSLDTVRQSVIVDMAFNLGVAGLLKFKNMIAAIQSQDYEKAADEMIDSKWFRQVKSRGERLEHMMRTGEIHTAYLGG